MPKQPDFSKARCKEIGTELFFPDEEGEYYALPTLKAICSTCPVRNACLEWALKYEKDGIWAATTPRNRQLLRKKYGITLETIRYDQFVA